MNKMSSFGGCAVEELISKKETKFNFLKEEEWTSDDELYDGNEKPPEEPLNSHPEDETNLITLNFMEMKNFYKAQGVTDGDVMDVDREIEDMMESVKNLQMSLSEDDTVDDIFKVETSGEQASGIGPTAEDNVKASIEEIEKMDAILRVKAAEERRAKLCRIQAEEESRDILCKLPRTRASGVNKVNLEEFIRLLCDFGETGSDSLGFDSPNRAGGAGDKERSKDNGPGEKKTESRGVEERKAKNFKFVEKNIQLAKCGRGTLSLTDEEKERIEELLVEAEDSRGESVARDADGVGPRSKELYAIDDETKSALSKIDQQLEAVLNGQDVERSASKLSLLSKRTKEEDACEREKNDKNNSEKGKAGEKKRGNRLTEINELLNAVNSVTHEEITPLSEEEIESLLEQSKRSLDGEKTTGKEDEKIFSMNCKSSEDVISELVANAKLLMPKFKYRFVDS